MLQLFVPPLKLMSCFIVELKIMLKKVVANGINTHLPAAGLFLFLKISILFISLQYNYTSIGTPTGILRRIYVALNITLKGIKF